MWKAGVGEVALTAEAEFDAVVEPGEYAEAYDRGLTVPRRSAALRVAPVVYQRRNRMSRAQAACELGLDPDGFNALIQLGAGRINDVDSLTGRAVRALEAHGNVSISVARSELSAPADGAPRPITAVNRFPLSPFYAAFDVVLLAAGYNSFHEALSSAAPAIFVPNAATRTDDQHARSRWARDHGLAREWDGRSIEQLVAGVEWATDAVEQERVRARLLDLPPATGAEETADWIRSCL
jgi:hypothetical protein